MSILIYENNNLRRADMHDLLEIVKSILLLIPIGKVTTYKEIALMLKINPRLVGKLMSMNDEAPIIPCHRVVRSNGHLGGYSLKNGVKFKKKILLVEGVRFKGEFHVSSESIISLKKLYE